MTKPELDQIWSALDRMQSAIEAQEALTTALLVRLERQESRRDPLVRQWRQDGSGGSAVDSGKGSD